MNPAAAPAPRPLLALDDALQRLVEGAARARRAAHEHVSTFDALGRVLAEDVRSTICVPGADNSAMDGYALRAADGAAPGAELPVSQRIPAGRPGTALQPGTAARIFTGALVPPGADTVIPQEQAEALPDADAGLGAVRLLQVPRPGEWIRRRGEDVPQGAVVLAAGSRLTPQALGLAASVGVGELAVVPKPRVALFSTGDELVMPGQPLPPGAIYNSNRFTLRGLLLAAGCEVIDLGIVPDSLSATRAALRDAAAASDLIVTCGGVSVGEEDHLKPAALAEGELEHWQLAIKPGKPLAFGRIRRAGSAGEALLLGLPGNPVSAWVTFVLCVGPVLRTLVGAPDAAKLQHLSGTAGFDWPKPDKRREFLRVRLGADGRLLAYPNQSSGVLTSVVWAEGLLDNPPGHPIRAGDAVRWLPMAALLGA